MLGESPQGEAIAGQAWRATGRKQSRLLTRLAMRGGSRDGALALLGEAGRLGKHGVGRSDHSTLLAWYAAWLLQSIAELA